MATPEQAKYLWDLVIAYPEVARYEGYDISLYESSDEITTKMSVRSASDWIGKFANYAEKNWPWRPLSKQAVIAEMAYQYCVKWGLEKLRKASYDDITFGAMKIGLQGSFRPLVFTRNVNGQRVPVSKIEAEKAFRRQLSVIQEKVDLRLSKRDRNEENIPEPEPDTEEAIPEPEPEPEPESPLGKQAEEFWDKFKYLREFTETRNVGGHQIDTLERRPYIAGAKMIVEGIPNVAIFHAMTMHWPAEVRREQGIEEYDVRQFHPEKRIEGMPPEFPYLVALRNQRINPWLISPAGVGKTTVVQKFADHFGQPHCAIPLNRGTSPSAFNGRPKLTNTAILIRFMKAMSEQNEESMVKIAREAERDGDVTVSEFSRIFRDGGHILLDEIDAGDENLLMMVNMPLANGRFANTASGETYEIHPDTLIWAASNTMGLGVSAGQGREYRGRNALDFATIDRFRMGRVVMRGDIDEYRKNFEQIIMAYK